MDDIVARLRTKYAGQLPILLEAADEIERLRKWASYEHAGYCRCAGGDAECVNNAYEVWRRNA